MRRLPLFGAFFTIGIFVLNAAIAVAGQDGSSSPAAVSDNTPRYYAIEASGAAARSVDGSKMCFTKDAWLKQMGLSEPALKDLGSALAPGCTHTANRTPTGTFYVEEECSKAAGAPVTSRMTISGSLDQIDQHLEVTLEGLGSNGDQKVVSDTRMRYLGACPADVKPGQVVTNDGKIHDPAAELKDLTSH